MVQTSKTDHFFKLAPFCSPLTDLIDFGMAGKLLTSATRWCSPFVDSVSRIWIKPKKSLIGCWAPTATTFGQSAPSPVQLTTGRNGHNRHFERLSLVSSVCRSLCTGKIELYSAITTKSKIFDPLFLDDPVGWLLQFFIGRKNMYYNFIFLLQN